MYDFNFQRAFWFLIGIAISVGIIAGLSIALVVYLAWNFSPQVSIS